MSTSSSSPSEAKQGYTPFFKSDGTKLTKAERRAANKAKFAAEQAAKRKASKSKTKKKLTKAERSAINKAKWAAEQAAKSKSKTKTKTARLNVEAIKEWSAAHPDRKTVTPLDLADWSPQSKTKTAKALDRKGRTDSGLSKRNNKLEVQDQYKGGQLAAF